MSQYLYVYSAYIALRLLFMRCAPGNVPGSLRLPINGFPDYPIYDGNANGNQTAPVHEFSKVLPDVLVQAAGSFFTE